jgi:hypothetical protein
MDPASLQLIGTAIGTAIQTVVILAGGFIALGVTKNEIKTQGSILSNLDRRIDKLETAFIQVARQDERLSAMDLRMLAQGKRIDGLEKDRQRPYGKAYQEETE